MYRIYVQFNEYLPLLLQERQELTREQTALKNQLHVLFHQYYGNNYRHEFKNIFSSKALTWYQSDIKKAIKKSPSLGVGNSILRRTERLTLISTQILEITTQINSTDKTIPEIKTLTKNLKGYGTLTACKIIVEIDDIKRFESKEKLAKYAGIAPVAHQASSKGRLYTNKGGNRKLNQAIHTVALSQIGGRGYDQAKIYYQRKQKEGKSKLWSLRCLKRQIINKVFVTLKSPPIN